MPRKPRDDKFRFLKDIKVKDIEESGVKSLHLEFENENMILNDICQSIPELKMKMENRTRVSGGNTIERYIYSINEIKYNHWENVVKVIIALIYFLKLEKRTEIFDMQSYIIHDVTGIGKVRRFRIEFQEEEGYQRVKFNDFYRVFYVQYEKDGESLRNLIRKLVRYLGAIENNSYVILGDKCEMEKKEKPAIENDYASIYESKIQEMKELLEYKENGKDIYSREYYAVQAWLLNQFRNGINNIIRWDCVNDIKKWKLPDGMKKQQFDKLIHINGSWNKGMGIFSLKEYAVFMHRMLVTKNAKLTRGQVNAFNEDRCEIDRKYFVAFLITDGNIKALGDRFPNMTEYLEEGLNNNLKLHEDGSKCRKEIPYYEYEYLVVQADLL